jgi:hypothetical protein
VFAPELNITGGGGGGFAAALLAVCPPALVPELTIDGA